MPNATSWIVDISSPSWDEVYVTMKNSLSSTFTGIHSNIKAIDRTIRIANLFLQ
jgi:hypothetical protein